MWSFEISVLHSCGHFPFIYSCNRLMLAVLAKTYCWQYDRQIKLLCFGLDKLYHNSGYYTKWAIHAPKWHIQTTNVGHTRVDTYMWTNFRHSHTFSRSSKFHLWWAETGIQCGILQMMSSSSMLIWSKRQKWSTNIWLSNNIHNKLKNVAIFQYQAVNGSSSILGYATVWFCYSY